MTMTQRPPLRALLISLGALAIPVAGAFFVPAAWQDYEALLWLLAAVPAFLLAYYKGWRGAALALAVAMAVVSVTYAITQISGHHVPDLMLAVLVAVIGVSLGAAALAGRLKRDTARGPLSKFTDPETGLPNQTHAELYLETEFAASDGRALSVVLFDVDNLKGFNARHGAIVGDEVVHLIAEVLKKITRRMNLSARYGDDEFLCVLSGADEEGSVAYVKRFMQSLHELAGERALPSISGGVATVKPSMQSPADLVAAARTALKQAKKEGRGRLRVYGGAVLAPAAPEVAADSPVPADARKAMPEGRGRGRRVLIVAEQQPVRALLSRYLNDHGFNVTQASNVVDAIQSLAQEHDLLFTDVSLEEGFGTELVRAAKLRWPAIQVIGIVPETTGDVVIDTLNAGVDRFLVTPLDLLRVRQHMAELLDRRDRVTASLLEGRQLRMEYEARAQEAYDALRETQEEYRRIVRNVREVVFRTDRAGNFTFLNEAWQDVSGFTAEESLGSAAGDFVHGEDRAEFVGALGALVTGQRQNARGELRIQSRNGDLHWLELRASRLFDAENRLLGVSGTLEDVTLRRQAEEALRRSEAASRGLLAALPDEVLLISRKGTVLDQQGAVPDGDSNRHVGASIREVFPADIAAAVDSLIESALRTEEVQVYEYAAAGDAEMRHFELRIAPSGDDAVVAVVRDVTDRSLLEEEVRQSQKLEAIGRLAGGLAHDFNNLLTVIHGNAHLLGEELQSSQGKEYLQQIEVAADRGAALVRQLLAFSRRQVLQPALLDLNMLVEKSRPVLTRLIGEGVELEIDLEPGLGLIKADAAQIQQVLINLATNARDAIREHGTLRIATRNSALAVHGAADAEADDVVLLTVSDTGRGMDAATLERVFEPFFTTKGRATASGLGLATVYGIVQQSGGTISVSSEPGTGTSFEIALPRADQ